eukprot:c12572_g1_i1.p1 GENE.c12572_g1_i1~~c12572_g1_i1.p1  ORF type:complete len:224 (+),score=23.82 c12572_g1_i1:65-673(+)
MTHSDDSETHDVTHLQQLSVPRLQVGDGGFAGQIQTNPNRYGNRGPPLVHAGSRTRPGKLQRFSIIVEGHQVLVCLIRFHDLSRLVVVDQADQQNSWHMFTAGPFKTRSKALKLNELGVCVHHFRDAEHQGCVDYSLVKQYALANWYKNADTGEQFYRPNVASPSELSCDFQLMTNGKQSLYLAILARNDDIPLSELSTNRP